MQKILRFIVFLINTRGATIEKQYLMLARKYTGRGEKPMRKQIRYLIYRVQIIDDKVETTFSQINLMFAVVSKSM